MLASQSTEAPEQRTTACPSCGSQGMGVFYEATGVPVNSCLMVDTQAEALAFPKHDLRLAFCHSCGFITNQLFDAAMLQYSADYEETQGFSPTFNAFARGLAQGWIDRYDIRDKLLIEIGCGKGEFLALMCELGHNRGIGIDPAYVPGRLSTEAASRIDFVRELYTDAYDGPWGDVVVCRHTLEHIQPVRHFMRSVRRGIGRRLETTVLFELPDVTRVLLETAFWDVYYEHCSYFSLGSLARLFRATGFEVLDLYDGFDGQYLLIEARPSESPRHSVLPAEEGIEELAREVAFFEANVHAKLQDLRAQLDGFLAAGRRPVVWGSGSKAVAYLTALGVRDEVEYVVDINPFKHGKFLAGTGHEIVGPEFLRRRQPGAVILMNSIYREEVQRDLDRMGIKAPLVSI